MRTNVPVGDPTNQWHHKYMYKGLHVVCDAHTRDIIFSTWTSSDLTIVEYYKSIYEQEILSNHFGKAANAIEDRR